MSMIAQVHPEPDDRDDEEVTSTEPLEGSTEAHLLVLGDSVFTCPDELPVRYLLRYATGGVEQISHVLEKLVRPEDVSRMWDAFEAMPNDEAAFDAVEKLMESYSDRPTEQPASSPRGLETTKRS